MRKSGDLIPKLRPWSFSTFLAAAAAVAFATTMQEVMAGFGERLCFAAFVPAVLIASMLGGIPAGIFAVVIAFPIVWWAFMPPYFEFSSPTPADYDSFALFALTSALVICFAHLYREALAIMRR